MRAATRPPGRLARRWVQDRASPLAPRPAGPGGAVRGRPGERARAQQAAAVARERALPRNRGQPGRDGPYRIRPPSRPPYSSSREVEDGATVSGGVRRDAADFGRLDVGRELLGRLAPGRVLALDAVRGLAGAPFLAPFVVPFLALAVLALAVLALAVLAEVLGLAVLALALDRAPLALAALDRMVLGLVEVPGRRVAVRVLPAADRADRDDDVRRDAAEPVRLARAAAGRGAAGLAAAIVLAAVFSALAAVVMALVAVFMDRMAVDIVLADELARVAAAVILVAAVVTLVAADETVLAAATDVGPLADEVRVLRVAVPRPVVPRPVVPRPEALRAAVLRPVVLRAVALRAAVPRVRPPVALVLRVLVAVPVAERAVVLRADRAAVPRVDELAPVARAEAVVLGRPAERLVALVLTDRVLPELAGLRRAVAPVVVCTGTDFPPS
jgi:hypothetical protein